MSERNPFQQNPKGPLQCEEWEALLVDALDGTLEAVDKAAFDTHGRDCSMCAEMLAQAKQGREWMQFLHEEPPVPADLVSRILDRTSGASLPQLAAAGAAPVVLPVTHFTMRRSFKDARMLMTAAMAFFSIALTLNMIGIRVDTLRMADLKPSTLQMNIARQFYGAKKQMVSYYENLRLVYEVESKMREFRQDVNTEQNSQPSKDEKQRNNPAGDAHKNGGRLTAPKAPVAPQAVFYGEPARASLDSPQSFVEVKSNEVQEVAVEQEADQAERSLV